MTAVPAQFARSGLDRQLDDLVELVRVTSLKDGAAAAKLLSSFCLSPKHRKLGIL